MKKLLIATTALVVIGMSSTSAQLAAPVSAAKATGQLDASLPAQVSQITVPLSVDLTHVQSRINAELAGRLHTINENNVHCVKAEWFKTKIPEFRGFKIYSKTVKTKISPDLYCDLRGHVDRRGDLAIGGRGNTLNLSLPIHASVTAKTIGIQETAKADATFFINATPGINSEWQPTLNVHSDFRWDRRPEIRLLDMIKVTIGSKVEPTLRKEMAELEASVPAMLEELNLRGEVEKIWSDVQDPILISESPQTWAVFVPTSVGFSGFNVVGQSLDTQVSVEGETRVFVGEKPQVEKVALMPLTDTAPETGQFSLAVPIAVQEDEVQVFLDDMPSDVFNFNIDEGAALQGTLQVSNMDIEMRANGGLSLLTDVHYDNRSNWLRAIDIFDWFDVEGRVELTVIPALDASKQIIYAQDLRLDSDTNSGLADTLVNVMDLPFVRDVLAEQLKYDFSEELAEGIAEANAAMNQSVDGEVHISGALVNAGVRDLVIKDGLMFVVAEANGAVSASFGALSN
ncbi:DUF4403 family protein [uncultured Roseobacter sp.]|uniref:DUF4403 family protein n=1 Tax=uncultured Roseobacter sp. TaxID=114847 RepID=UPI002604B456|nr:DUF4403 family protein [uncultured Roseobacter sp.]